MSIQNLNPYYMPRCNYGYPNIPQVNQPNYSYAQNPYSASFFNQGIIFPYIPNFKTQNSDYVKLGELVGPNDEITHLYRLSNGHEVAIMQRKDAWGGESKRHRAPHKKWGYQIPNSLNEG